MESDPATIEQIEPMPEDLEDFREIHEVAKKKLFTKPFCNVLVSAVVMCLVYSAFFPGGGLLDVVITDGMNTTHSSDVGFLSQSLTFASSIPVALITPFVINTIGIRATMGISSILYSGLFIGIIFMKTWTIYLGSVITGVGMGLTWVVMPKVFTDNSTMENLQRNNTIWWCIYMMSMVIGNTADYLYLGTLTTIDADTRLYIYLICCAFTVAASLVGVMGYRNLNETAEATQELENYISSKSIDSHRVMESDSAWERMKLSAARYKVTLLRREVGLLFTLLIYIAVVQAFYTMTFQTCIGNTFTDRSLITLMGLVLGVTEVACCPILGLVCEKISNKVIVIFMFLSALASFYLTFLIFPAAASYREAMGEETFIKPQKYLVLLIAVLLGISDAGFNIILNSLIGRLFQSDSEIGFMLLNAVMSSSSAVVFLISPYVSLYALLGAEAILCTMATICVTMDLFRIGK